MSAISGDSMILPLPLLDLSWPVVISGICILAEFDVSWPIFSSFSFLSILTELSVEILWENSLACSYAAAGAKNTDIGGRHKQKRR